MGGDDVNVVALIVAILGVGGIGAAARELFVGISKLTGGMAMRESKRKNDIVSERDRARLGETRERLRAEASERNVRILLDTISVYRRTLIEQYGKKINELPDTPDLEDTISQLELTSLIDKEQNR